MLYTQALAVQVLMRAGQQLGKERYTDAANATLRSMLQSFRRDDGLFRSSLSAVGRNGKDGGHYLWPQAELESLLGPAWQEQIDILPLKGQNSEKLTRVRTRFMLENGSQVTIESRRGSISAKLKEKYPSNWELAGARSARVVRLLEEEGVASVQLISLSFGENHPVESNDTEEGRSRNRRIEIILRPVAMSLDQ